MATLIVNSWSPYRPGRIWRRGVGMSAALAVEVAVLLALLAGWPGLLSPSPVDRQLHTFDLTIQPPPPPDKPQAIKASPVHSAGTLTPPPRLPEHAVAPLPPPPPAPVSTLVRPPVADPVELDIGRALSTAGGGNGDGIGSDGTGDVGSGHGNGHGLNVQPTIDIPQLFDAEWVRQPRDDELARYLPSAARQGWGEIICRTGQSHHVHHCRPYREFPAGSGFAKGFCDASWQFLVRGPRVDGEPVKNAEVLIHIQILGPQTKS
ncbi:MAG: hypothetical protein ACRCSO_01550 [Sphingomonas sp.]